MKDNSSSEQDSPYKNSSLQFAGKYYLAFILICDDGDLRYTRKASGPRKSNSNKASKREKTKSVEETTAKLGTKIDQPQT